MVLLAHKNPTKVAVETEEDTTEGVEDATVAVEDAAENPTNTTTEAAEVRQKRAFV
jgi:hypothetical protein